MKLKRSALRNCEHVRCTCEGCATVGPTVTDFDSLLSAMPSALQKPAARGGV